MPQSTRPRRATVDAVRLLLRGVGQTLVTVGVIILLFVVYEVWVTNLVADRQQAAVRHQLEQTWAAGQDPISAGRLGLPSGAPQTIPVGTGIANLYIPRFGTDYAFTIVQGVDGAALEKGPGHYPGTALPGQVGNFSVAGHRVGKGEPFLNLDQLQTGDALVVETKAEWYVYRVLGDSTTGNIQAPGPDGIPGREIVAPDDGAVIAAVPDHPGEQPTGRLMTFTTCHPKYTANQRMVIHAKLARTVARHGNVLPRELAGGTI